MSKILHRLVTKYRARTSLSERDEEALLAIPHRLATVEAGRYLVREGSTPDHCILLLSGLAYRHKITLEGARQIVSIHVPGDFLDLEGTLLQVADHNIQVLVRSEIALIAKPDLYALIDSHPRIARALWVDTLIDAAIFREWVVNIGRRDARERLAHLFCEVARRLQVAGLGSTSNYELPMTQEQLADATGLTPVHVNRTLRAMEAESLIRRDRRHVAIPSWERLRSVAGFSELYLHLDQVQPVV
jgi:CRP-like cAMP-binding protein